MGFLILLNYCLLLEVIGNFFINVSYVLLMLFLVIRLSFINPDDIDSISVLKMLTRRPFMEAGRLMGQWEFKAFFLFSFYFLHSEDLRRFSLFQGK